MVDVGRHPRIGRETHGRLLWVAILCLLLNAPAWSYSRSGKLVDDFKHTGWGPKEGAPSDARALAQTTDGFIWISSLGGLFRFDGINFERVDLSREGRSQSTLAGTLFAPSSGGLWIAFVRGGAGFLKDGRLTFYGEADGLAKSSITGFAQDSAGVVWAIGVSSLSRLEGSHWRQMGAAENFVSPGYSRLMMDSADTLWIVSPAKVLFLPKGEKLFREAAVRDNPSAIPGIGVPGITESASGAVWLFRNQAIQRLHKNSNPTRRVATSGAAIASRDDGSLWVARADGKVQRIADPDALGPDSLTYMRDLSDLFPENELTFKSGYGEMLVDREANVWLATLAGVDRFSERNVDRVALTLRDQEPFVPSTIGIASGDDGSLWVGGRTVTLRRLVSSGVQRHDDIGLVYGMLRAGDGTLWFETPTDVWKSARGQVERTALPGHVTDQYGVQAMAQDRSGALWVALVRGGLHRLENGQWMEWGNIPTLPRIVPLTMSTDEKGRLWFGYRAGGLAVLDGNDVTVFAAPNLPPVGAVTAIHGTRGPVWVGGETGLALFDGVEFHAVRTDSRIALDGVTGIVGTADGDLWLNAAVGLVHIDASEVARLVADPSHRVRVEVMDASDGIVGSGFRLRPTPTLVQGTDGRLWFVTNLDLYTVDPKLIKRNAVPPPVVIKSVTANDEAYAATGDVSLPARTTSLRIDYAALSMTMPEKVRYRYKLDGVDRDWQEADGRHQAYYTNLGPGSHRFHVIAANNDGVWNETGATLDFIIAPTFFQTWWFVALSVLAAGALVVALIHLRFRQLATRMRLRFNERMTERERIARELHDTLLQGTQGLILSVQGAADYIPAASPAREILARALERADTTMSEGRDRILDLRVAIDESHELAESLAVVGDDLTRGSSVSFRTQTHGAPRAMTALARQEAYQVAREALINAFRHAHAKSIEVAVIYDVNALRIRVRDDGLGMTSEGRDAGPRPGHWGLVGMRERAAKIGAQLDVRTWPDNGTQIELLVPGEAAYGARAVAYRWNPRQILARMRAWLPGRRLQ